MNFGSRALGVLAIVAALGVAASSHAAVTSYLSTDGTVDALVGPNPGGPAQVNLDMSGGVDTGSLYIWLRNDAKLQSVAYDIMATTPGVIEFTGGEVFQYDLLVGGVTDIGDRWNLPTSVGTVAADGQGILNMSAVNVDKAGLEVATRSFDAGYEAATNAALFGRIDFKAIGAGTTDIALSTGSTLIVENSVIPDVTFFGGSVNVEGGIDPPSVDDLELPGIDEIGGMAMGTVTGLNVETWSDVVTRPATGAYDPGFGAGPAATDVSAAPTFDPATQKFSWDSTGAYPGTYRWLVSGSNSAGDDTGLISVELRIPEPASIALLGLSIVGFAGFRRK